MKYIIRKIYYTIIKLKLRLTQRCRFGKGSDLSRKTKLEGFNTLGSHAVLIDSYLGYASYLSDGSWMKNCLIGKFSSIGPFVYTVIGKHPTNFVSTHTAFYSTERHVGITYVNEQRFKEFEEPKYGGYTIKIGNDVWIGAKSIILDGVNIGDGAIIGAGALVTKDVPPYAIVGGVPAKIIRYRFESDEIDFLLRLKWWDRSDEWLRKHAHLFNDIKNLRKDVEDE